MLRIAAVLLLALGGLASAEPPAETIALQNAIHKIIDAAEPSIACILVSRSDKYAGLGEGPPSVKTGNLGEFRVVRAPPFNRGQRDESIKRLDLAHPETVPESYGSGIVIDERGLVLTNYHVVDRDATKIYVRLPGAGRGSYANILAADARSDLAVLEMIRPPSELKAIPFGDGGKVRKGDWVISLANPFAAGFQDGSPSASWGIVSNLRRQVGGPLEETKRVKPLAQYGTLMQTDARLNIGCSGGALLNLNGELIGLSTSLAGKTGGEAAGGYAIPIDANVKKMIEVLKRGEEIEYGFLGVTVGTDDRGGGRGVEISAVALGQPAARAGLYDRDMVVSINGNPVRQNDDLFLHISAALAGSEVEIQVRRGNELRTVKARLAKSAPSEKTIVSNRPKAVFGLRVDYTSTLSLDSNPPEGVLVRDLEPGTAAEKKLKDWTNRIPLIVVSVDGKPVATPADFHRFTAGKASITLVVVEASRDSKSETIILP